MIHAQHHLLVEAESFVFNGGWEVAKPKDEGVLGKAILFARSGKGSPADASTVIDIKQNARYTVWARGRDYKDRMPGTRLFQLFINDIPLQQAGKHGRDGFYWENIGEIDLKAGKIVLRLHAAQANSARADAFFISTDAALDPNNLTAASIQSYLVTAAAVNAKQAEHKIVASTSIIPHEAKQVALIENAFIRLKLMKAAVSGTEQLYRKIEIRTAAGWYSADPALEDCQFFLLRATDPGISFSTFYPTWSGSLATSQYTVNGKTYTAVDKEGSQNPFLAGELLTVQNVQLKSSNDRFITLTYELENKEKVEATWTINPGDHYINVTFSYIPSQKGFYSFALAALQESAQTEITNVQLPPLYQYQRIPARPNMIPGALAPQPITIVETRPQGKTFSSFITPEPNELSRQWVTNSVGFSLKNYNNKVQPVAFAPVLGMEGSEINSGTTLRRSFKVGMMETGWEKVLAYASDFIFEVRDYRKQSYSLIKAIFNQIDLMKNESAGGWNAALKGFYDIEADPATAIKVVQAAPLAVVEAAILTKDEQLYKARALPTIEYILSRKTYRWGLNTKDSSTANAGNYTFSPFNTQFNSATYDGLNRLLGNKNPWLSEIALPGGKPRYSKGYGTAINWPDDLAAYRMTHDKKWLSLAISKADSFLKADVYGKQTDLLGIDPFYNVSNYATWFDLPDLYELTKQQRYKDAAVYTAHFTLAGIRSYPKVRDEKQIIHPKNQFAGNTDVWWKGNQRYKMGHPRTQGDVQEKQVPEYLVSPVGLSLEQPMTFFGSNLNHIYMSSWAPGLLRLNENKEHNIFETYARNAVIGRFANYPGYYASGYSDLSTDSAYPYKGPDVTSIYYHHIPPHLAFSIDFLVTEAVQRSSGKINFPYGKQQGFVWFNNRIYGGEPGTILKDTNTSLWIKRGLVSLNDERLNYLTAISDKNFYIILMNEADKIVTAKATIGNGIITELQNAGKVYPTLTVTPKTTRIKNATIDLAIPAKGLSLIVIPLRAKKPATAIEPLTNGFRQVDLKEFGQLFIFRIRSPFGWDSMFGYLSGKLPAGYSASFSSGDSSKPEEKTRFPFEWSIHPIKIQERINWKLIIKDQSGQPIEFKGTL